MPESVVPAEPIIEEPAPAPPVDEFPEIIAEPAPPATISPEPAPAEEILTRRVVQREGIIGPPDGPRPREVLKRPDWLEEIDHQLR